MATQLFNFQPLVPQHYTLAETQGEKDAELQRKIAAINAQNSGQMAESAMRAEYAQADNNANRAMEQQRIEANQQQLGVENGMDQQKIDAAVSAQQQQQAQLGARAAAEAEANKRDVTQQDFQNNRLLSQDAREAAQEQRKAVEWTQAQDTQAKHDYYANLGQGFLDATPDKNGEIDFTANKSVIEQGLGGKLPGDVQVRLRPNADNKGYEAFAVDKEGTYNPILKHEVPVSFGRSQIDMAVSAAKANMGMKPEQKDLEVIYDQKLGPDGMTLIKTPVSVFDKKSGTTTPYNAAVNTTEAPLSPAQKALAATKIKVGPEVAKSDTQDQPAPVASNLAPKPLVTYADKGDPTQAPHNASRFAQERSAAPASQPKTEPAQPSVGPRQYIADQAAQKGVMEQTQPQPVDKYIVPEGAGVSQEKFDSLSDSEKDYLMNRWQGAGIAKGVGRFFSRAGNAINSEASRLNDSAAVRRGINR
jgi:hypothetical protein